MKRPAAEIKRSIREALRQCSLTARGLWWEMEFVMVNESTTFGHLLRGSERVSERQLASMAGFVSENVSELQDFLAELKEAHDDGGRALLTTDGRTLLSPLVVELGNVRRSGAVRQQRHRERLSNSPPGALHGVSRNTHSNASRNADPLPSPCSPPNTPSLIPTPPPSLKNHAGARPDAAPAEKPEDPHESAISRLIDDEAGWVFAGLNPGHQTDEFRRAFAAWVLMKRDVGKLSTFSVRAQIAQMSAMSHADAVAALKKSVASGWSGVHKDKEQAGKPNGQREQKSGNVGRRINEGLTL
jgi:hypothetical protein